MTTANPDKSLAGTGADIFGSLFGGAGFTGFPKFGDAGPSSANSSFGPISFNAPFNVGDGSAGGSAGSLPAMSGTTLLLLAVIGAAVFLVKK